MVGLDDRAAREAGERLGLLVFRAQEGPGDPGPAASLRRPPQVDVEVPLPVLAALPDHHVVVGGRGHLAVGGGVHVVRLAGLVRVIPRDGQVRRLELHVLQGGLGFPEEVLDRDAAAQRLAAGGDHGGVLVVERRHGLHVAAVEPGHPFGVARVDGHADRGRGSHVRRVAGERGGRDHEGEGQGEETGHGEAPGGRDRCSGFQLRRAGFPVAAVEGDHLGLFGGEIVIVEHADVHGVQLRRRPRAREHGNATDRAEMMLRDAGAEAIGAETVLARKQAEAFRRHAVVQEALLAADRAVALGDAVDHRVDFEADRAAVAASGVARHPARSSREAEARPVRGESGRGRGGARPAGGFAGNLPADRAVAAEGGVQAAARWDSSQECRSSAPPMRSPSTKTWGTVSAPVMPRSVSMPPIVPISTSR